MVRVPGVCNFDPATTVPAHVRLIGVSGMGLKSPDLFISFCCAACHAVCDGQHTSSLSASERRLLLLEGMMRTQAWLVKHGYLNW